MADPLMESALHNVRARLLIVEDDDTIRDFCRLLLRQQYDITVAANGAIATELLAAHDFDLVLTDLQMPVMGGMELLSHIRQHHPEIDTILLTAHATFDTARQALRLGALDYLVKPIDTENLERTVRTCLELRRTRQEKERLSDLVLMYQFSQAIATSLDVETQVAQIVEFLWQRFSPVSLALSMLSPADKRLHLLASRTTISWLNHPLSIALTDPVGDTELFAAHWRLVASAPTADTHFAGMVLRSHDQPLGYLHLTRSPEQPPFDGLERRLLGIFVGQVAASLDNARLYQTLIDQNRQTIEALAEAIEARDSYTSGHSQQVTRYAVRLAEELGLEPMRVELVRYAGLLHDVGKIGIRDYVLLKPGKLSADEFAVMKRHPRIGVKIIERVEGLRDTLPIIEAHHERVDGLGYPNGLKGDAIPLEARILAIADAFEAMTADRAYRPAMDVSRALETLARGRGTHWDARLIDVFTALILREGEQLRLPSVLQQDAVPLIRPKDFGAEILIGEGQS